MEKKILRAQNHLDPVGKLSFAQLDLFEVKNIMLIPSMKWLEKRMPLFRSSILKHCMKWPVVVTTDEYYWKENWPKDENGEKKKGMCVHTGNKRVLWAKEQGYDLIEGYFVKSLQEKNEIIYKTYIARTSWPQ